ncbi:redoxin family protein [Chitinophaga sp. YIM B06452]|uniref:TlpA family protein disulfide reductase n=1 Tax=Chitinophaga sp. YIM B06452 TaxID=3082158 RepID=UPI0031FEC18A
MRMFVVFVNIFLFFFLTLTAQVKYTSAAQKGSNLPDITITNMVNHTTSSLKLSDLRGKIVVLDFWSRGCGSCIASFPKVEYFNTIYRDKVFILPVTMDSYEVFQKLKVKSQIIKESSLPFALGDKVLHKMYPHQFVPYCVWFNEKGQFIATSNTISQGMIDSVLASGELESTSVAMKVDVDDESFSIIKTRLNSHIWNGREYFSKIRKLGNTEEERTKGLYHPLKDSVTGKQIGISLNGLSILEFIAYSYGVKTSNVVLESNALSYLKPPKDPDEFEIWRDNNVYSIDYIVNPENYAEYQQYFNEFRKQDIQQELGIVGELREVIRPCYILRRKDTADAIPIMTKSAEQLPTIEVTSNGIFLSSSTMKAFVIVLSRALNRNATRDFLVIDETNISYKMDFYLKVKNLNDDKELGRELSRFGFDLKLEDRSIRSLVLREQK